MQYINEGGSAVKNLEIRMMVSECNLKYRDIAKEIGISPEWLSRLLREELSPENEDRILKAIEVLEKGIVVNDLR